jgi:predicted P-loop ATPase
MTSDRILIVDAAHQAIAAAQFPSLLVLGNKPTDDATLSFKADILSGKTVYLWCHYAALLAEELNGSVPDLGIVNGNKTPMSFASQPGAAITYLKANVRRYKPPASKSDPWATPDNIARQAGVQAVAEAIESKSVDPPVMTQAPKAKRKVRERTEGTSWADFGLVLNDDGIPITTLDNCVHVIEQHPDLAGHIWYDSFLSKILHTWGVDVPREWADYDDIRLALYMQRDIGIPRVSPSLVADAVICYAMREVRNCAYDWLDSLQWDGRERLNLLATLGFGAESNDYTAAVCRNLVLAMVKRVFSPGCKSDYMPVFEGSQGVGKSKLLNILGGEWFAELHMDWNNKDFYCALQGKMLLEIGELHAFKQTDVDKIKGIVSCAVDRYREPFGRHTKDFPRQGVFAGTTNRDDWNRDDTGARRFWPVLCGKLDHEWVRVNRDQLFAEAVHVIRAGGSYWEVPWGDAQAQQDERRAADTWDDAVAAWLVGRNKCTLAEVMAGAVDLDAAHQTLSDQQRMGRVMKKVGWVKKLERVAGIQRKVWVNPLTLDLPEPPVPEF